MQSNSGAAENPPGESLNFHIFSYKQRLHLKERPLVKWAKDKLTLTEKLIGANRQRTAATTITMDEPVQTLAELEGYRERLLEIIGHLNMSNIRKKGKRRKLLPQAAASTHSKKKKDKNKFEFKRNRAT